MLTPPGALLALLFTKSEPLAKKDASKMLGCNHEDLGKVVLMLHESLAGTGLTVIETESELELRTAPETSEIVKSFREDELARDLGKGSLETLAVIKNYLNVPAQLVKRVPRCSLRQAFLRYSFSFHR